MIKLIWLFALYLGVILVINAVFPPANHPRSLFKVEVGTVLVVAGYIGYMRKR